MMPVPVALYEGPRGDTRLPKIRQRLPKAAPVAAHQPFLTIHGNVTYDGFYQSNTDTPYLEKDIYQHTLQTNLDITIRDQYPLHLSFSTSKGNSMLYRNLTGLNLRYSNRDFKQMLMNKAAAWDAGKLKQLRELDSIKGMLENKWDELNRLRAWFNAPQQVQRLIEAKEHDYRNEATSKIPAWERPLVKWPYVFPASKREAPDNDSALLRFKEEYARRQQQLDSMQRIYGSLEKLLQKKQLAYGKRKSTLLDALKNSRNDEELSARLSDMNLPDSLLPKGYKALLAVRSFGIGRTMVDYSELTAKNISITGVQAELNPGWYLAFATGAVDYRFRDYVVNAVRPRQYLNIVRAGFGLKDGNNIILSYYTGKKQVYNFNTGPGGSTTNNILPDTRIMGLSLEGKWQISKHHYIIGEVAKSSMPYYARAAEHEGLGSSMLHFGHHSNEALALSAFSYLPVTDTRISGMYKLMGADFQSFSLYASGAEQIAWMVKVEQPFFRKQLLLTGSVKRNTYNSVFDQSSFNSSTVFKSIQATFRRKRWPVLSVGYFPSSQLTKISEGKYMENMFYTLMGTATHSYSVRGLSMNTMFSGTRFYNHQADSNFVYFNSTNLQLNHTVFAGKFVLNGGLSSATNTDYALYGADGNVQYRVNSWLEIGGGAKYNYQTKFRDEQIGYSGNARLNIPKVGEFIVMADKGFIPGVNKQLVPNKTGRLTYTRIF